MLTNLKKNSEIVFKKSYCIKPMLNTLEQIKMCIALFNDAYNFSCSA